MRKSFLLAISNIRKSKGQTIAMFALILIASMLLNMWLVLFLDYTKNFDRRAAQLDAEDVSLIFVDRESAFQKDLRAILEADSRTDRYSLEECLAFTGTSRYRSGEMNTFYQALPVERAKEHRLGQYHILEQSETLPEHAVWLPCLYKEGGGYALGDPFDLTLLGKTHSFKVAGFYENMINGSFNGGICTLLFDEESYRAMEKAHGDEIASVAASVKLTDRSTNEKYAGEIGTAVLKQHPAVSYNYTYYDMVKQARSLTATICTAIISGIACLIVFIALIVLASNISHYIGENMKNLGALKAMGYQSRQLVGALLLQFLGGGFLCALIGITFSYGVLPTLNKLLLAQTGIPYILRFQVPSMLFTLGVLLLTIFATVLLSTRKIRKIEPVVALRQGIKTHSFKRNVFPLADTKAPLGVSLTLKTTFGNMRQNVTMLLTVIALSLLMVFSCVMLQNFVIDSTPFLGLVAGEQADVAVGITEPEAKAFQREMEKDPQVAKVYLYNTMPLYHESNSLSCYVTEDAGDLNNPETCYAGRFPRFANEVALGGRYAKEHGLEIGNTITLTCGQRQEEYLITGLQQCTNYLGRDALLLTSGYERLGEMDSLLYYFNLKDGVSPKAFLDEVNHRYGTAVTTTANIEEVINGSLGIYTDLISIIVGAILLMTAVVILFILYLMVKTLLLQKKVDYGVLKAIGFTTRQLVLQTAGSFMPSVILATVAGSVLGGIVMNPMLTLFFRGIGIMQCSFTIPVAFVVAAGGCMVLTAFLFACLLSLRIRKIAPRALLVNE